MSAVSKDVVTKAYAEALAAGTTAKLYVSSPDKLQIKGGSVNHTYEHAGAAQELADMLPGLKAAGQWDDDHGRWAFALRHGAGIEIGRGARGPKAPKTPPAPPAPKTELEKLEVMLADQAKLQAALTALTEAIAAQTKVAEAEQIAKDEAEEAALNAKLAAIAARKAARQPVTA